LKLVEDAPPERCGGMVVGERSRSGRRAQELGGVEAGQGEDAQPFGQLWQEGVHGGAGNFCSDQLPPFPFVTGIRCGESLVELLLEDSAGAAELGWPGGSQVAGVDLAGGAPHLYVGDQFDRHWSMALGRPGWRVGCGVAADLVGELSNTL
jgi:hypothetical protein